VLLNWKQQAAAMWARRLDSRTVDHQRVDSFTPKIGKLKKHTLASVVSAMNESTQDFASFAWCR